MSDAHEAPKEPKEKDTRTDGELRDDIARSREQLASTLDALEYKFDIPARLPEFVETGKRSAAKLWDDNPLLVIGVGVGVAVAVIGAIVGGIVLRRRDEFEL
ncbi:DUF3618 domain-containing protein [Pseudoclavibacter chungangensis]|uniref:DUF3618 domain-containing protein n=1 Tax=Pseudoclavibacter chungangensis TaxID=587635 RepID=A0A7J5BP91_9MICO|nr:DUF3618 domain-containing protein [Pseudoclavibacter chungangensis]KAB1654555.1 DUF3618 domain-containing protein [Pseudoclavibacter chungangensis]NYJ68211.1 hypothetical protein [Pseudoclavibacter chungangensis]